MANNLPMFTKKYPKIHRFLWDIEYLGYRFWLIVFVLFSILIPITLYFENKEKEAYVNSKITIGIVDEIHIGGGKSDASYINFHFYNDKKELIKMEDGIFKKRHELSGKCLYNRKIGDTVIIKYSTLDNSYAKIIECYWNNNLKKKYGFYKW